MKHVTRLAGLAALVLGMAYVSTIDRSHAADASAAGVPVSEAEFKRLVAKAVENVKKGLEEKGKAGTTKARGAAIMIAAYAQYGEGGGPEADRATLRDAALKLAAAIKAGKPEDAVKQADALADLKADPKAKPAPVLIMKEAKGDTGEIMRQFSPPEMKKIKMGGLGIEDRLRKLTAGKVNDPIPAAVMNDDFVAEIEQVAAIAALFRDNPQLVKKDGKKFTEFAEHTRELAVLTAEAAKKKDGVTAKAQLYKLTISCNKCHDKFREEK